MTTKTKQHEHVTLPGVPDPEVISIFAPGELAEIGVFGAVPILEVRWQDERTGCARAHRYLAGLLQGVPSDYSGCHFYRAGRCSMNGQRADSCLFHEAETSASWAKVRRWRLLAWPDGRTAVTLAHSAAEIAAETGAQVVGAEVMVR